MVTIGTDLKDVLAKIESKLDRIEQKLEALPRIEEKLEGLDNWVDRLEDSQNQQIWALIVAIIGAMIAAIFRFCFTPNP